MKRASKEPIAHLQYQKILMNAVCEFHQRGARRHRICSYFKISLYEIDKILKELRRVGRVISGLNPKGLFSDRRDRITFVRFCRSLGISKPDIAKCCGVNPSTLGNDYAFTSNENTDSTPRTDSERLEFMLAQYSHIEPFNDESTPNGKLRAFLDKKIPDLLASLLTGKRITICSEQILQEIGYGFLILDILYGVSLFKIRDSHVHIDMHAYWQCRVNERNQHHHSLADIRNDDGLRAYITLRASKQSLCMPLPSEGLMRLLDANIARFNERERNIIASRYGLYGESSVTLEKIGYTFGVTKERVRQINAKILRKLRLRIPHLLEMIRTDRPDQLLRFDDQVSIGALPICSATLGILYKNKLSSIRDLTLLTKRNLVRLKDIGNVRASEIKAALEINQFSLRQEDHIE